MINTKENWDNFLLPYKQVVEELVLKFKGVKKQKEKMGKYSEIEGVSGRVKTVSSILNKASKYGYEIEQLESKLFDIAGIRIISQFEEDIYEVVNHIKSRDDMKILTIKDYIKNPKESGYKSIHLIVSYGVHTAFEVKEVLAEIQIRTLAMDFWATIEHSLNYKYQGEIPYEISSRLKTTAKIVSYLDSEMSEIKDEVTQAQNLFRAKSTATNTIIEYISILNKLGHLETADKYIKIFTQISEKDDALQLLLLKKELGEKIQNILKNN